MKEIILDLIVRKQNEDRIFQNSLDNLAHKLQEKKK